MVIKIYVKVYINSNTTAKLESLLFLNKSRCLHKNIFYQEYYYLFWKIRTINISYVFHKEGCSQASACGHHIHVGF